MTNKGAPLDPFIGLVGMVDLGRRYSNAPIIEATVDLRVSLPDSVNLGDLQALYPDLDEPDPYYQFVPRVEGDRVVEAGDGPQGYKYQQKRQFSIIAGLDRFTYSQLSKYQDWDQFIGNVETRWQRYKEAASPSCVTNVGVRFVNRIVIQNPQVEINDYLRTTVDISPYLPQAIERYFAQISFPIAAFGVKAIVTTALDNPRVPDTTALILDIDVSHELDLDPTSDSFDNELTAEFDTLRNAKNYVFEACITDATRGVIDRGDNAAEPHA
ncbi:hypothetical protein A5653_02860 [Mycobacterium colombiense]|uniref:TIGR04255 family protein n=1 Tax=Mycobacterium TaxID=1763 RepID=UPI0007EF191C|nr:MULTISPECIES: TIGR04255 family protein [Mycobacterium]OBK65866.1 hypothetical protein A5653_02860 [Mycobacterium colombiense]